jgi:hypothetical protein
MIKTTLNMNSKIEEKLIDASISLMKSKSEIIKLLLEKVKKDRKGYLKKFIRVKYQNRDPDANWMVFHINFTNSEYEHFLDMRKFFKSSLSRIIALAVEKYLHTIEGNNCDNYDFSNYLFEVKIDYKGEFFRIEWETEDKRSGKSKKTPKECTNI